MRGVSIVSTGITLWAATAMAATCYIRAGAGGTGSGSDWTNAYPSFTAAGLNNSTAAAARGNTYYVAGSDQDYGSVAFRNPASADQLITVKKATYADHGTETGWNAAYATAQARFTAPVRFESDDWVFDGMSGGGPGSWDAGYGFKVADTTSASMMKLIRFNSEPDNVIIRHTDCIYEGNVNGCSATDQDAIYGYGNMTNITLSYCAFQYAGRAHVVLQGTGYVTVEYCYHLQNRMNTSQHAESWADNGSDNVTIRHNFFRGCQGTGIIVVLSRGAPASSDNWEIYGNVFFNDQRGYTTNAVICVINDNNAVNWKICNNTFVDMKAAFNYTGMAFAQSGASTSGIYVCNNLWYDCDPVQYSGGATIAVGDYDCFIRTTHSAQAHEQTGTSDPFVNYAALDFRLSAATQAGQSLAAPYDVDMYGNERGADGTWDRGAFEFGGQTAGMISGAARNVISTGGSRSARYDPLGRRLATIQPASSMRFLLVKPP